MNALWSVFGLINFGLIAGFLAMTVVLYVLLFKLIQKGIRALDLYILEKERSGL